MSRYPLIDTGFTDAMMGGANLGLRAVALQDQQRQAQVQAELERQRLGIDQGNLDARLSEQTFRQRQYDDRRGDLAAQRRSDAAAGDELAALDSDIAGMNGPPMPPAMMQQRLANIWRRASELDPATSRFLMAVEGRNKEKALQNKEYATLVAWINDDLGGGVTGKPTTRAHQREAMMKALPQILNMPDPMKGAQQMQADMSRAEMLKIQVGNNPELHQAIDDLAQTPGALDEVPDSTWAAFQRAAMEQTRAEQEAALAKKDGEVLQRLRTQGDYPDRAQDFAYAQNRGLINQANVSLSGQTRDAKVDPNQNAEYRNLELEVKNAEDEFEAMMKVYQATSPTAQPAMVPMLQELARKPAEVRRRMQGLNTRLFGPGSQPTDHGNTNAPAQPTEPPPQAAQPQASAAAPAAQPADPARRSAAIRQALDELGSDAPAEVIKARVDTLLGMIR